MPSELEKQRSRAQQLTRFAIEQHNRRAREIKAGRLRAEKKAEEMVARQEERYRNYIKAQQIRANSGGGMAGALQGGMTGFSLGMATGNPYVAAGGAVLGAIGGGLYGASEGRQAVADVAPYAAGITQVAGGISQMQANKERTAALGQMYGQRGGGFGRPSGGGFGGQPVGYGAPQWSGPQWDTPLPAAGGVSLTPGAGGLAGPSMGSALYGTQDPRLLSPYDAPYAMPMGAGIQDVRGPAGSPYLNYYEQMLETEPGGRGFAGAMRAGEALGR